MADGGAKRRALSALRVTGLIRVSKTGFCFAHPLLLNLKTMKQPSDEMLILSPDVLRWARERAGLDIQTLAKKLQVKSERIISWENSGQLTITQAEKLAHYTHTPLGYLYLPEPVKESLPIRDFRTVDDQPLSRPTPDLIETIQIMQRRQAWMREEMLESGQNPLAFVGSSQLDMPAEEVACLIKKELGLEPHWTDGKTTWEDALRTLRNTIEAVGVLVVFNGVVGNDTHRKLSTDEFRGFALLDEYAPLIFVNSTDYKGAQMFTLVHELAHIWIGQEGLSNLEALQPSTSANKIEKFCNQVAAEFLVPANELLSRWDTVPAGQNTYDFLARSFKVSTIVVARRALDLNLISSDTFFNYWYDLLKTEKQKHKNRKSGGDFWNNQNVRVGVRFGSAVVRAVKEGRLLYREAYALTGLKGATFIEFSNNLT